MRTTGSAFSRQLRARVTLRALAAGSASAGDRRSGNNTSALVGTRYFSRYLTIAVAALGLMVVAPTSPGHAQVSLGTAFDFGVLAGSTVTNTVTPTVIGGNVGVWPGTAITNFPPGAVTSPYAIHAGDAVAQQAQADNTAAYITLSGLKGTLLSGDLGAGRILTQGVYNIGAGLLTGTLTLDAQGNPNAVFIINISSTLITATGSKIVLINGAQGGNVFFTVGSSATLGVSSTFNGDILALTSITLDTGAIITCGGALAQNAAVTLDNNRITVCKSTVLGGSNSAVFGGSGGSTFNSAVNGVLGEVGTGAAPTGILAMNSFLSLVTNFSSVNRPFVANSPALPVKALPSGIASSPYSWGVWGSAYGSSGNAPGDITAGSHDRSASAFGFATGVDYRVNSDTLVGFALAGGGMHWGLTDSLGNGNADMFQAAFYGVKNFNAAYVAAAIAYGYYNVSTDRVVGADNLTANFNANDVGGRVEGGYRFSFGQYGVTPYVAEQMQAFRTPAYSEIGSSVAALAYNARTTIANRTEVGSWFDWTTPSNYGTLTLRSRLAWAHDQGNASDMTTSFISLPGASFTVVGAPAPHDLLLASLGAAIGFRNGFSLAAWFDGEFAGQVQRYAGTVQLRYSF